MTFLAITAPDCPLQLQHQSFRLRGRTSKPFWSSSPMRLQFGGLSSVAEPQIDRREDTFAMRLCTYLMRLTLSLETSHRPQQFRVSTVTFIPARQVT